MKKEDFFNLKEWFQNYLISFDSDDPFILQNLKLKEEHSSRVCENASQIAVSEGLGEEDYYLAITIALLHDIGRFDQITRYRTFQDSKSENHALLGVKILKSEGVLSFLSEEEQNIILMAVKNHNLKNIPEELEEKALIHSRLIRDADKLDIYKILTDYYVTKEIDPNPALEQELPDVPEYSQYLIQDIFNNKVASIKEVKTCNDMKLTRLAWLFDLNFITTLRLVKERGYIEKVIAALPHNGQIDAVHAHLNKYMDSKLDNL